MIIFKQQLLWKKKNIHWILFICLLTSNTLHSRVLSHIWLSEIPWIVACQAFLSMEFPRQEYWSGLPFPVPGNFKNYCLELFKIPLCDIRGFKQFKTIIILNPVKQFQEHLSHDMKKRKGLIWYVCVYVFVKEFFFFNLWINIIKLY